METINTDLILRLKAIKLAYASGAIRPIPYIETNRSHREDLSYIILNKESEDDEQGSSGGGGATARGFKKSTRPKTNRR